MAETADGWTRREFLNVGAALALAPTGFAAEPLRPGEQLPWYRRASRWGQTNITEKDPIRYDIAWWRGYWKRTRVQAIIVNAGGIVAYYPSKFPLHHRAAFLDGRDLFGELTKAAHDDGLWVMARMDSNRAAEDFFQAHPDWFARDREGRPIRAADKYVACINSPYYEQYLPDVLREIIERAHPDGFTDNSWAGLGRESICYCDNCARAFRAATGAPLPAQADWNAPAYRQWITWSYARRTELWEFNNRVTREAGGRDCIWSGMNSGSVTAQARSFRDLKAIGSRAAIMMLDHQRRDDDTGFQQNSDTGMRVHEVIGWDALAPESMAMYESGPGYYRVAAKPAAEARQWMIAGIAGGIQPWWHHVGAAAEDRRMYDTAEPVMRWHQANERYLMQRTPVATVGLAWSQRNTDFFGRDEPEARVDAAYTGFMHALVRARIPYRPLHIDEVDRHPAIRTLILPNVGAMSDGQAAAVRRFAAAGGAVIATGQTSLYDEWGEPRPDFALADLFRCHRAAEPLAPRRAGAAASQHTYLRLPADLRARHEILRGFEGTDVVAFGGTLTPLRVDAGATIAATFVPPFPTYPPETAWMREPSTDVPGIVLSEQGGARVAYLPADLDRRYAAEHLPDHARLLASIIRWAAGATLPLEVTGTGFLDCRLYEQPGRLILHLVNLTSEASWRAPLDELIRVGPFDVSVAVPRPMTSARRLVSGETTKAALSNNRAAFRIEAIDDHEVVVIE
jgi:putative glycosyl hydrolase-like family 6 (GHL6) protein